MTLNNLFENNLKHFVTISGIYHATWLKKIQKQVGTCNNDSRGCQRQKLKNCDKIVK